MESLSIDICLGYTSGHRKLGQHLHRTARTDIYARINVMAEFLFELCPICFAFSLPKSCKPNPKTPVNIRLVLRRTLLFGCSTLYHSRCPSHHLSAWCIHFRSLIHQPPRPRAGAARMAAGAPQKLADLSPSGPAAAASLASAAGCGSLCGTASPGRASIGPPRAPGRNHQTLYLLKG